MNISTFHTTFQTEDACVAYLEKTRWNGEPICPRCESLRVYRITTRKCYKCAGCRRNFTVRNGTIFEDSKLPLTVWFSAVWLVTTTRAGISSVELSEKLQISQKAAWFVLQRIQYAVSHGMFSKLEGHVEIDDMRNHRNHDEKIAIVLGAIERQGEARLEVVEHVSKMRAIHFAQDNVEKGSAISTDQALAFHTLSKHGYTHNTVNHSKKEYARGETSTNTIDGFFGIFQRRLAGIHINVSKKHLQKYCDAYAYRHNVKDLNPVERFEEWFTNVTGRLTYSDLIS